ncbi:hypothetical protein CRUP_029458 [Coryphaenoides rupestris]|nr:hypothetical protein CRUP_029458 [Coryphaenoides rupestris]
MQAPTTSPGTSFSTAGPNVTKSKEQIMIQKIDSICGGRHTHVSRMLGTSKSRQKMSNNTTATASPSGLLPPPLSSGTPMRTLTISSVSAGVHRRAGSASENGGFVFGFPRAELSDTQHNDLERHSNGSGSTSVTIHDVLSLGNT